MTGPSRMTERTPAIGIVGAGTIAVNAHIPVLRAMDTVRIAWVADAVGSRARAVCSANGLQPVVVTPGAPLALPPADAVLLSIPLHVRRDYFDAFAPGSAAVFAEKPFALNATEHARIIERYEPWRLACGYQRRHYATSLLLRALIARRVFGELKTIRIAEGGRTTRSGGASYIDKPVAEGGGLTLNLGCHSLDLALWLTGATDYRIVERAMEWDGATDRHASARIVLTGREGAEDCGLIWRVSWLETQDNVMDLEFETANIRSPLGPAEDVELFERAGAKVAALSVTGIGGATTINQAFYLEWRDFLACFKLKRASTVSAASCLLVAKLMDELLTRGA